MMQEVLIIEEENGVFTAVLNNPPMNTLHAELIDALADLIDTLSASSTTKALILTGSGEKAFAAGADINEFLTLDSARGREMSKKGQDIFDALSSLPFPVICALNGYTLGAGLELALATDIRIAEEQIKLGLPEVNLGIIPGYGGTQRLSRLIGIGKAKEFIFSGDYLNAEEALRLGVVEKVVPRGTACEAAKEFAQSLAKKPPLAIAGAKKAINQGIEISLSKGQELERKVFGELCDSEDAKEGANAFLEKRKPLFRGV
ncbi:enoyl-CoA hydratase-related protein [Alkalihalophilus lindianensis]|uniref:Enoyl-CoA hydratase-related protein n=1 Tax=Alkalihalophilus lindianensis TaxID=1630542 RepID=A0ABU3XDY8_9BACI|nr:enoyl-CoA hydratase-related protein [Alkalihalophilus lindianensis]MDV2686091.1 enoyl-CoA hydratase-related protein [Alkalihalophilus lindianensis]